MEENPFNNPFSKERRIMNERHHQHFMSVVEDSIKDIKEYIKTDKDHKDLHFHVWNVLGHVYNQAYNYFRDELFELTDAEDIFRDKIRDEI